MATNSGRRPGPDRTVEGSLSVSGHSERVQSKVDDITIKVLDKIEARLDKLIEDGTFEKMSRDEIMDEFRKTVRATKRPATTINLLKTGDTTPVLPYARGKAIDAAAQSPEEREALRKSHERAVRRQDGT